MELNPIEMSELNVRNFAQTFTSRNPTQWTQTTGIITQLPTGTNTVTVKVLNQNTTVSGVPYISGYAPKLNQLVIIKTNGSDMYIDGALSSNNGFACVFRASHNTPQTAIATGTSTLVVWDTAADTNMDPFGGYDTTNKNKWTIPVNGYYFIQATTAWAVNATGVRETKIVYIPYTGGGALNLGMARVGAGATASTFVECTHLGSFTKGDQIQVYGAQYSGGALQMDGDPLMKFSIFYVGSNR